MSTPYDEFLGVEPWDHRGTAFVLHADDRHVGDHERRSLHGGVLSALCEHAAMRCLEGDGAADGGTAADAVTITCHFVREAGVADTVAEVDVIRRGRRFANVAVTVWQGSPEHVVAVAQAVFRLLGPAPSAGAELGVISGVVPPKSLQFPIEDPTRPTRTRHSGPRGGR